MATHMVATQSINTNGFHWEVRVEHSYVKLYKGDDLLWHLPIGAVEKIHELISATLIEYERRND